MAMNKYSVKYDNSEGMWKVINHSASMVDYKSTKQRAVDYAKYRARDKHRGEAKVKVYKQNGQIQNTFNYGKGAKATEKESQGIFNDLL